MRIGMVGLGKMGANMTLRLLRGGHEVVAYDVNPQAVEGAAAQGAVAASSMDQMVSKLESPRVVWVMVPAGATTQATIDGLSRILRPGDIIIDGGNSRYTDTVTRASSLFAKGLSLVDAGTSGGIWGLEEGYCLMVGADAEEFARLEPLFETLAPDGGYARVGPPGAGHFVKMVHNGIEYGLMQAYGEGFELMKASPFELDLPEIAELWRHGSVVRSWLLDLLASALADDPRLERLTDYVEDSGEGRWALGEAIDRAVPAPALATALFARFASRQEESFSMKVLAALRKEFGGHAVRPPEQQ
ncbi:MAG: decarboxylating 6-phosphogluconate dehydrogenase [Actinomycetota bacterium]|nr:decarboxylating 6-phosphogluconate dehydrogenase [Actinomycetota bacterium]